MNPSKVLTARKYSIKYFWYRLLYGKPLVPKYSGKTVDYYRLPREN